MHKKRSRDPPNDGEAEMGPPTKKVKFSIHDPNSSAAIKEKSLKLQPKLDLPSLQEYLQSTELDSVLTALHAFRNRIETESATERSEKELLFQYLQSSAECAELFELWDSVGQNRGGDLALYTMELLAIILRKATAFKAVKHVLVSISKNIIKNKLVILYSNLNTDNMALIKATLKILTGIASLGPMVAQDLLRSFNFGYKTFLKLVDKRVRTRVGEPKSDTDWHKNIRTYYLRLALALLTVGDGTLAQEVIAIPQYFGHIYRGLCDDHPQLITDVIEATLNHILLNKAITKKAKSGFFGAPVLDAINHLFVKTTESSTSEDPLAVLMLKFMYSLCSSNVGILYRATGTFVPNARLKNQALLRIVQNLKPTESVVQQNLLISILAQDFQLHHDYFANHLSLSIDPRPSAKMIGNLAFVARLIELSQNEAAYYSSAFGDHQINAEIISEWMLPIDVLNKSILSQYFTQKNRYVIFLGVCFLEQLLKSVKQTFARIQNDTLVYELSVILKKRLPEIATVVTMLKSCAQPNDALLKAKCFSLLQLYLDLFPEVFTECRFDFAKLHTQPLHQEPALVLFNLISLFLHADGLQWNTPLTNKVTLASELLTLLSKTDTEPQIRLVARQLLQNVLTKTGLFDAVPSEIEIWMDMVDSESAATFLSLLAKVAANPYVHTQALQSLLKSAEQNPSWDVQVDQPPFSALVIGALEVDSVFTHRVLLRVLLNQRSVHPLHFVAKSTPNLIGGICEQLLKRKPSKSEEKIKVDAKTAAEATHLVMSQFGGQILRQIPEKQLNAFVRLLPIELVLVQILIFTPIDRKTHKLLAPLLAHADPKALCRTLLLLLTLFTESDMVNAAYTWYLLERYCGDEAESILARMCVQTLWVQSGSLATLYSTHTIRFLRRLPTQQADAAAPYHTKLLDAFAATPTPEMADFVAQLMDVLPGSALSKLAALIVQNLQEMSSEFLERLLDQQDLSFCDADALKLTTWLTSHKSNDYDVCLWKWLQHLVSPTSSFAFLLPKVANSKLLKRLFKKPTDIQLQILQLLLQTNYALFAKYVDEYMTDMIISTKDADLVQRLPMFTLYLSHHGKSVNQEMNPFVYKALKLAIQNRGSETAKLAEQFLVKFFDTREPTPEQKNQLLETDCYTAIFTHCLDTTTRKMNFLVQYLEQARHQNHIARIAQIKEVIASISVFTSAENMTILFRAALSHSYDSAPVFQMLYDVLRDPDLKERSETRAAAHDLLVGHSLFAPTLFEPKSETLRLHLVQMLHLCYQERPDKCTPALYRLLVSAFNASCSETDQVLAKIIILLEEKAVMEMSETAYLWGAVAQEQLASMPSPITGLSTYTLYTIQSVFFEGKLLASDRAKRTLIHFDPSEASSSPVPCLPNKLPYHTPFLLPYLYFCLSKLPKFDSRKFVELGGLSLAIMGLSSPQEAQRLLSYAILARFEASLEGAVFLERQELVTFLAWIRLSITERLQPLPALMTSFLAHTALVLVRPEHPLYVTLNDLVLSSATVKWSYLPLVHKILNGTTPTFQKERMWMLEVIRAGIKSVGDVDMLKNQRAINLLQVHFASDLVTDFERVILTDIFVLVIHHDTPGLENSLSQGMVPWLTGVIAKRGLKPETARLATHLLNKIHSQKLADQVWVQLESLVNVLLTANDEQNSIPIDTWMSFLQSRPKTAILDVKFKKILRLAREDTYLRLSSVLSATPVTTTTDEATLEVMEWMASRLANVKEVTTLTNMLQWLASLPLRSSKLSNSLNHFLYCCIPNIDGDIDEDLVRAFL